MPLIEEPLPLDFANHTSYSEHTAFVDEEIAHAVSDGTFVPIRKTDARIVNPVCGIQQSTHKTAYVRGCALA